MNIVLLIYVGVHKTLAKECERQRNQDFSESLVKVQLFFLLVVMQPKVHGAKSVVLRYVWVINAVSKRLCTSLY